ncbi:hypothetical protein EVAR_46702_1 [Eumeta japonica]|uniref:Uncharacterized protein n=1 Tax=Eumeta variegata TaxID=151549 RepID=A0A4C1XDJ2_EUMVA|nr:hypothetical protein EVAR_46702_1 [Eumeta japonica]
MLGHCCPGRDLVGRWLDLKDNIDASAMPTYAPFTTTLHSFFDFVCTRGPAARDGSRTRPARLHLYGRPSVCVRNFPERGRAEDKAAVPLEMADPGAPPSPAIFLARVSLRRPPPLATPSRFASA